MEIVIERVRTQDDLKHFIKVARHKEIAKTLNYLQNIVYRDTIDKVDGAGQLYVAFGEPDGKTPVGALYLYFYKKKPVLGIKQIASLHKTVGGQLFTFACNEALQRGIYQVTLEVTKTNENAIGFYEHYGMHRVGEGKSGITYVYELMLVPDFLETSEVENA